MSFPLGKLILAMAILAIVGGIGVALRPSPQRADLVMWVFAEPHASSYRGHSGAPREQSLAGRFERLSGKSVDIKLVNATAENIRLLAMFDRTEADPNLPDIAEIEIGSVGRYFRPPVDQVGFLPLNDFLETSGFKQRLLESRLAPWTKDGVIFGIPHDVHPVSITYRKDLFDEAGIDLASAQTWPQFQALCLEFQHYWRSRGHPRRHAIELPRTTAEYLIVMLLQRHINVLDDRDEIHLTNRKVAETVAFYAHLVAGSRQIAGEASPGANLWSRDFARGDICAIVTPDWRTGYLKRNEPGLAGKVAMMPLPRFDPDDSPTASWGGTMAGIIRRCRDPQAAWELLTFLYSSKEGIETRWRSTTILPAVVDLWDEPVYHEPDPYFADGQRIGELYIALARQMPRRYVTPYTALATAQLNGVLGRAIARVESGVTGQPLIIEIDDWLRAEAEDLRRRIAFAKFEPRE